MQVQNPYKDADEKLLFAKVLDKYVQAQMRHMLTYTAFLDPVRCAAFIDIIKRAGHGLNMCAYGGYENAERKIIAFDTCEIDIENFPIAPIAVTYNGRFCAAPTHRDYLGAVLGLGIVREKVGDIAIGSDGAVVYIAQDVALFVCENLNKVGRVTVQAAMGEIVAPPIAAGSTRRVTVASMRLDAVLSAAFNLSRGKASSLIEAGRVFVDWKEAKKNHTLTQGNTITVRGMGRVQVNLQGGTTKKDRIVLEVTVSR